MPVRVAHHHKVSHDTADVGGKLDQDVLRARQLRDAINFLSRIALKPKMIEPRFDFILHDHEHKGWILSRRSLRSEPDVVPPFQTAITNYAEAAKGGVEINRAVNIRRVDGDVGPARR